jgi:hypothetical protein
MSLRAPPRCPPCGTDSDFGHRSRQLTIRHGVASGALPIAPCSSPNFSSAPHSCGAIALCHNQSRAGRRVPTSWGPPSRVSSRGSAPAAPGAPRLLGAGRGSPRGCATTPSEVCETTRSESGVPADASSEGVLEAECVEQPLASDRKAREQKRGPQRCVSHRKGCWSERKSRHRRPVSGEGGLCCTHPPDEHAILRSEIGPTGGSGGMLKDIPRLSVYCLLFLEKSS